MPAAWEVWTLWWLAAFQFAVAYWWWRGPRLEGTKRWVPGLFLLNGVATVFRTGMQLSAWPVWGALRSVFGLWTNLFLLGVGLVALVPGDRWRKLRWGVAGVAAIGLAAATPDKWIGAFVDIELPIWYSLLTTSPLLVAGAATGAAIPLRLRGAGTELGPWLIVLGGLAMRHAELVLHFLKPRILSGGSLSTLYRWLQDGFRIAALAALIAAFVALVWALIDRDLHDHRLHIEAALAMLLAGFVFGAVQDLAGDISGVLMIFGFAVVRPAAFVGAQVDLHPDRWTSAPQLRYAAGGAILFVVSVIGLWFGGLSGLGTVGRLLTGAGALLLALPLLHALRSHLPRARPAHEPATDRDWRIEEDRVALPDDWTDQVEEAYRSYRQLPEETRRALDGLSRWQRIVLALDGAPESNPLPAYERTTPGLHLWTHCPYSVVGPEISRANERWERIVEELGIDAPDRPVDPESSLIEGTWGQAEGLDSPRVKSYTLTDLGERVAEALREEVGLGDRDPEEVARAVGEGFADAPQD